MCGIAGAVSARALSADMRHAVRRMRDGLVHRGPDGEGEFADGHAHLAVRRLAIIDLEGAAQPLFNETRDVVLVANAEIYNFEELRRHLLARGHRFATGGDCEVILHLYEEHGIDFVRHLHGMFALALWDVRSRRLVLARDRMGEKPLYLYEKDGLLLFASELKALMRSGIVPFETDAVGIDAYFHLGWIPEPRTAVKDVRKLDAAHVAVVDVDGWKVSESAYWSLADAPALDADPAPRVRECLHEATRMSLRSDVPVGVALSGGLDSACIAAAAAQVAPGLQAFTVGYAGRPACDERDQARMLAAQLGLRWHEIELRPEDVADGFARLNAARDDPIADISGTSYLALMACAREHGVKVMLQGQGGDELFWGYGDVNEWLARTRRQAQVAAGDPLALAGIAIGQIPRSLHPAAWWRWAAGGAGIADLLSQVRAARARAPGEVAFFDEEAPYVYASSVSRSLYGAPLREALRGIEPGPRFASVPGAPLDVAFTELVCRTYLRENGIAQGDRLSMTAGVEQRLPFMDTVFVETVVGLRKARPDSRLPPKSWLREAARDLVPAEVRLRPKRGFAPPVDDWLHAIFRAHRGTLDSGWLVRQGVLSAQGVQELCAGATRDPAKTMVFRALVLEHWARAMEACRVA